jgi:hypothetical protein
MNSMNMNIPGLPQRPQFMSVVPTTKQVRCSLVLSEPEK